jgi:hypothetical protein
MDNFQKILILCSLDYLLENNDDDDIIKTKQFHQHILVLYLMIHHFPYHNIYSTIYVNSIQQGNANFLFENANNQILKKITCLN